MIDESQVTSEQKVDVVDEHISKNNIVSTKKKKKPSKKTATNGKVIILAARGILEKNDLKEELLRIDDWDGSVWVRGLTSSDHEEIIQSSRLGPAGSTTMNMIGYQAKVVSRCVYDDSISNGGKRIFDDSHYKLLMGKASGPISQIVNKCHELSGIGQDIIKRLKENLEMTQSGGSLSD